MAILTQLLLLEDGEGPGGAIKRLEDFLEREYHVTQNCSSIIRDPALMSRVGRVVLYGEREGVLFRGMSLQDICLELDGKKVHLTVFFFYFQPCLYVVSADDVAAPKSIDTMLEVCFCQNQKDLW